MKHYDKRQVSLEAAEWFIKIEDRPLSGGEKSAFLAWLGLSPLHVAKYLSAARVARCLPLAFEKKPIKLIDTLLDAVPEHIEESERRTYVYAMLASLHGRPYEQGSPLPVTIRRKGNGVSKDA